MNRQLEGGVHGGDKDGDMKDTACWEIPAGNYVDGVETRHGFEFWERRK